MNDTVVTNLIAEARALAGSGRFWICLLGASLVLGLAGPFGTYEAFPVAWRLGYWAVVVVTTYWLGALTSYLIASLAERAGALPAAALLIGALAASLPVTLWLALLHGLLLGASVLGEVARLLPYVAAITTVVAVLAELLGAREAGPVAAPGDPEAPVWLDQLPEALGRDLILLHAQDHYVRAETERGETLIRTTLEEASEALGDYGLRLHRSWWVARRAIVA